MHNKCTRCGRTLKDAKSMEIGMGPVCRKKAILADCTSKATGRKASYEIVEDKVDVLCIRDIGPWDKYSTVTNAAESVVADLAAHLHGRRLEYFDSAGHRDQILVAQGKFVGFAACPVVTITTTP